jgi:hypothetical protein
MIDMADVEWIITMSWSGFVKLPIKLLVLVSSAITLPVALLLEAWLKLHIAAKSMIARFRSTFFNTFLA